MSSGIQFTWTSTFSETNYSAISVVKKQCQEYEYNRPIGGTKVLNIDSYSVSINNVSRSTTIESVVPIASLPIDEYSKMCSLSITSPINMSFVFFIKGTVSSSGTKVISACTFAKDTSNSKSYNINASITFSGVYY